MDILVIVAFVISCLIVGFAVFSGGSEGSFPDWEDYYRVQEELAANRHQCKCYVYMAGNGWAKDNQCPGTVGGTRATEFLSESCIQCPFYVMFV